LANEQNVSTCDQGTLSDAIVCHQQGNLDQATRIYRCLLDENPGNADAVHLLGVAALQRGDAAGAVELIGRAVALNPGEAAFHSNLAEAYREVLRLVPRHPGALSLLAMLLHVDYEETVADLKGTARRLLAWCGLEWEPACLAFYRTKQPIRTASVTQVRQPIYQRAVARWKHYERVLDSLFSQLPPHSAPLADDNSSAPHDCCSRIPPWPTKEA
jgi:tetratricopeptide (TPR) repeat protein